MIEDILLQSVPDKFRDDARYREGHIRILNPMPRVRVLGLHIPDMRKTAKELASLPDAADMAGRFEKEASLENLCYEEIVVWGLMLNKMKVSLDERLDKVADFVPYIDNWAVCDVFCGDAKWAAAKKSMPDEDRMRIWDFLSRYWSSAKEFEVRFAVIMSMSYFTDGEWLYKIFEKIESLDFGKIESEYISQAAAAGKSSEIVRDGIYYRFVGPKAGTVIGEPPYYVRMGVAWLLATALARREEAVRDYAGRSSLPHDVLKLYARKARESFRTRNVSPF